MSIFTFLVVVLLASGIWTLTVKRGLRKLSCSRSFSQTTAMEGDTGEFVEVVRNDSPYTIPWLRMETRISAGLGLGNQDNVHVSGEEFYCSLFTLMPYQQIRRRHKVRFLRRGDYDLGNASLTSGDLLGVFRFQRHQQLSAPVLVYPRPLDEEALPLPLRHMLGDVVSRQQLLSDPFLVRGIRAYQPGDPVRSIHWSATARTGQTQVRVHDFTVQPRLLVVLNMQNSDALWGKVLPKEAAEGVEYGIRMAATVCLQALEQGLLAGFAANMPSDDTKNSTLLLPAGGPAQTEELLTALARLKLTRTENILNLLENLSAYEGLDVLILSLYDSDSLRAQMKKLEESGSRAFLQILEGGRP